MLLQLAFGCTIISPLTYLLTCSRDAAVVPSNIVLDGGHSLPMGRGDLGVRTGRTVAMMIDEPANRPQRCRLLPNYFGPCDGKGIV